MRRLLWFVAAAMLISPVFGAAQGPAPVSSAVMAAHLLSSPDVPYPAEAAFQGISGDVVLQTVIGVDGTVTAATVISGPPALRDGARRAVMNWHFSLPDQPDSSPTPLQTTLTVRFRLGGATPDAAAPAPASGDVGAAPNGPQAGWCGRLASPAVSWPVNFWKRSRRSIRRPTLPGRLSCGRSSAVMEQSKTCLFSRDLSRCAKRLSMPCDSGPTGPTRSTACRWRWRRRLRSDSIVARHPPRPATLECPIRSQRDRDPLDRLGSPAGLWSRGRYRTCLPSIRRSLARPA